MTNVVDRSEIIKRSRLLRRKRRLWRLVLWLAILILATAEVYWFANWEKLLLKGVVVTGASASLSAQVGDLVNETISGKYLGWLPRKNTLFYPSKAIKNDLLDALPEIETVNINKSAESNLQVEIKERQANYLWCDQLNNKCYFLDQTGFAFTLAPQFLGSPFFKFVSDLPAEPLRSRPIDKEQFTKVLGLRAGLTEVLSDSVIGLKLDKLKLSSPTEWIFSAGDLLIMVHPKHETELLLINLESALVSPAFVKEYQENIKAGFKLEYLDLRSSDKVFYKFS